MAERSTGARPDAEAFLSDPRILAAISPEVLEFLRQNQPLGGIEQDSEIGHWMGVTACVLTELAAAKRRIQDLEEAVNHGR